MQRPGRARLEEDGTLDGTFGTQGFVVTDLDLDGNSTEALALQSNGRILVTGAAQAEGQDGFALLGFLPDGTLDPAFGTNGVVSHFDTEVDRISLGMCVQPDGRILLVGHERPPLGDAYTRRQIIYRYLPDGLPDATWEGDGMVVTDLLGDDMAMGVAVQSDGAILVCGNWRTSSTSPQMCMVARYQDAATSLLDKSSQREQLTCTPNPITGSARINFALEDTHMVALTLYDACGRVVADLLKGITVHAGANQIMLDMTDLKPGVYSVLLRTSTTSRYLKVVKG